MCTPSTVSNCAELHVRHTSEGTTFLMFDLYARNAKNRIKLQMFITYCSHNHRSVQIEGDSFVFELDAHIYFPRFYYLSIAFVILVHGYFPHSVINPVRKT